MDQSAQQIAERKTRMPEPWRRGPHRVHEDKADRLYQAAEITAEMARYVPPVLRISQVPVRH